MEGVIGYIAMFAGNFEPKSWAFCNGQIIPISSNTALFSILGVTYGGNGISTFALPDLRGRTPVGAGQGPGFSYYDLGTMAGFESNSLSSTQLPAHVHAMNVTITPSAAATATTTSPQNGVYASGTEQMFGTSTDHFTAPYEGALVTGNTGSQQPFSTLHPVLGLNYIICMIGVFPARN